MDGVPGLRRTDHIGIPIADFGSAVDDFVKLLLRLPEAIKDVVLYDIFVEPLVFHDFIDLALVEAIFPQLGGVLSLANVSHTYFTALHGGAAASTPTS